MNATAPWESGAWIGPATYGGNKEKHNNRFSSQGTAGAHRNDPAKLPDDALVSELARGSRAALEALYERYMSGCYGLALKIVRNPWLAEEIVQDVFLKLWSRPESYVPERGKFSGWLLTLVHNRSVDKLRRAASSRQNQMVPLELENESGFTVADMLPDTAPTPYDEAWRSEQGRAVHQALSSLSEQQREAIRLAYFGGLTQREIAERLGEPLGTIKTRTRSGLLQLRRILGHQGLVGEFK